MSAGKMRSISRRRLLSGAAGLAASVGMGVALASCGGATGAATASSAAAPAASSATSAAPAVSSSAALSSSASSSAAPSSAASSAASSTVSSAVPSSSASGQVSAATSSAAAKAPAGQGVSIDFVTRSGPFGHTGWYKDTAPNFEKAHPGWTMNFIEAADVSVAEKFTVLAAGGSPPDVAWFGVISDGGRGPMFQGLFRAIDDYIAKDKVDISAYFPASIILFQNNGKQYGLPTHAHFGCNILYINQDMADRMQVQIPTDTAEWDTTAFITAAQKMTKTESDQWGWWPSVALEECGTAWLRTFGGDFFNADGTKTVIDGAGAIDGLQFMADAALKYKTINDINRKGGSGGLFEAGKLGILQSTPGLTAEYSKPGQTRVKFKWTNTVMPTGPGGKRGTQDSGAGQGVATGAKHADAAWEWVKFITDKDNGVLQVQGGAGSPGARPDVWADPRLTSFNHIYTLLVKLFNNTPGPLILPKNNRYFDVMKEANKDVGDVYTGKAAARDVATNTASAVNGILAQPAL